MDGWSWLGLGSWVIMVLHSAMYNRAVNRRTFTLLFGRQATDFEIKLFAHLLTKEDLDNMRPWFELGPINNQEEYMVRREEVKRLEELRERRTKHEPHRTS